MTYFEKTNYISELAARSFATVNVVSSCVIVDAEKLLTYNVVDAAFNFIAPVANHIFFVETLNYVKLDAHTGAGIIAAYSISPIVSQTIIHYTNFPIGHTAFSSFFCSRLAHVAGATGTSHLSFLAFDLTYT